jgi:hypothetical protein
MNTTLEQDLRTAVDNLNHLIRKENDWEFEMSKIYNGQKDEFIVIYLIDEDNGNKYRVYHSDIHHVEDGDDIQECLMILVKEKLRGYWNELETVVESVIFYG